MCGALTLAGKEPGGRSAPAHVRLGCVCGRIMEGHAQAIRQRAIAEVEVVARGLARQAHAIARVLRTQPRVSFFCPQRVVVAFGRCMPSC